MADETRRDDAPAPTRRDDVAASAGTRLDAGAGGTRVDDGAAAPTRRDDAAAPSARRSLFNLPDALESRYRIVEPIPTAGAEAELLIVESRADRQRSIAKLYRPGIVPKTEVLDRIGRMAPAYVVRLLEHGTSNGLSYELLEYCRFGSLRRFLRGRPIPVDWVQRILIEVFEAVAHLHGIGIIHRDLKPENVLIRTTDPLDLVLTDFGIASVSDASQHFTTASRTVKYGAPEAASGVISHRADYWSLGMMILEALTGRHPFEGLSEPVINQRLATRPMDVSAVTDERWGMLCKGLLHRNPEERWDAQLVGRWLQGDRTLAAAFDDASARPPSALTPYELENESCTSADELGVALARHWQIGVKDLARGFITGWLRDELKDMNLSRFVLDLADDSQLTPDGRLLRLIIKAAPGLPPIWRGEPLADDNLLAMAARASSGDAQAAQWLDELAAQQVLAVYASAGATRLGEIERNWKAKGAEVQAQLERLLAAENELAAAAAKAARESDHPADMDELMFGGVELRRSLPRSLHADIVQCLLGKNYESLLRSQLLGRAVELAADCAWFAHFGAIESLNNAQLLALKASLPRAENWVKRVREQRERLRRHELDRIAALRSEFDHLLAQMRALDGADVGDAEGENRLALAAHVDAFRELDTRLADFTLVTEEGQIFRNMMSRTRPIINNIEQQLGSMRSWLVNVSITGGGSSLLVVIVVLAAALPPWMFALALFTTAAAFGWSGWRRRSARSELSRLMYRLSRLNGSAPGKAAEGAVNRAL